MDTRIMVRLDQALNRFMQGAAWLVLPLGLLLCAQWPLRDVVHAYSREANDLGQILFGLYVSIAVSAATRHGRHLTPQGLANRYPPRLRRAILRGVSTLLILPWSGLVLYVATPMVWQSILEWERFPDTYNPGYFLLKIAVWLLAALVLLQTLLQWCLPLAPSSRAGEAGEHGVGAA